MDPEDCQVMNSKPSDPRQRRPDGQMYFVENEVQSGGDDWQIIGNQCSQRRLKLHSISQSHSSDSAQMLTFCFYLQSISMAMTLCFVHEHKLQMPISHTELQSQSDKQTRATYMCFAASCLTVSKTSRHSAIECTFNKWLSSVPRQ